MSPSVGNYLVDIKSFEQLALPTIKLNVDKSNKVIIVKILIKLNPGIAEPRGVTGRALAPPPPQFF